MKKIIILFSILVLSGCGGGDDGGDRDSNTVNTGGWLIITYPTEELDYIKIGSGNLYLSGSSFIGDGFTCSGAISLFYVTPCTSDVTITWTNLTSGETGTGSSSGSCWAGFCEASWTVSTTVAPGTNAIEITATDSYGNYGTDYLAVAFVETFVAPEHNTIDVPLNTTISATFNEPVSPPSSEDALYLTDYSGNRIDGTFLFDTYTYTFMPMAELDPAMTYTAHISAGQITPYGNADNGWRWNFTTVDGM